MTTPRELAELAASPTWMYEWDLGDGVRTAVKDPELMSVHETRASVMEPIVRGALAAAGPEAAALDLACSEGWFAHRLLDWGARRVLGVDIRPENVDRAELVRDRLGIAADRMRFEVADVFDLSPERIGTFDVVLCLGLIYHLENPVGALRIARALTRDVCVVESQMVEPHEPLRHGLGTTGKFMAQEAAWAAFAEPAERQESSLTAAHGGVVSLIPNRPALIQAMRTSGFERVECPRVPPALNPQYVGGHRLVVAGWRKVPPAAVQA